MVFVYGSEIYLKLKLKLYSKSKTKALYNEHKGKGTSVEHCYMGLTMLLSFFFLSPLLDNLQINKSEKTIYGSLKEFSNYVVSFNKSYSKKY